MDQRTAIQLFDHMYWVNRRLLAAAEGLGLPELTAPGPTTRDLRATLVHELDVEWSWRLALQGRPIEELGSELELQPADYADVAAIADTVDDADVRDGVMALSHDIDDLSALDGQQGELSMQEMRNMMWLVRQGYSMDFLVQEGGILQSRPVSVNGEFDHDPSTLLYHTQGPVEASADEREAVNILLRHTSLAGGSFSQQDVLDVAAEFDSQEGVYNILNAVAGNLGALSALDGVPGDLCTQDFQSVWDELGKHVTGNGLAPVARVECGVDQRLLQHERVELMLVLEVALLLADLRAIKRRLRDIDMAALHELEHLAVKESEQQRADMRAVDVGVGHDDDAVIAQLLDVVLFLADAAAERGNKSRDLRRGEQLVEARALDVEDLPLERQDGLEPPVAPLLGRAAGRLALDDVDLALGRVALLAVGQLARQ